MQESEEESRGAQATRLPTEALEGDGDQDMIAGGSKEPLEMHNQESLAPTFDRPREAIDVHQEPKKEVAEENDTALS